MREQTPIETDHNGRECHPSWGTALVSRVSTSTHLFDSSIGHQETVRLSISAASRTRDLHQDWITPGDKMVEVEMSLSQWAMLVSSFGSGTGVPVTVRRFAGKAIPEAPFESRLAASADEVRSSAKESLDQVHQAATAVAEAFESKAGRRELGGLIAALCRAIELAPSNTAFAAESLTRHTEEVMDHARADIEAIVQSAAKRHQLNLDPVASLPPVSDRHR